MGWARNDGRLPEPCVIRDDGGNVTGYRRVHVRLRGGYDSAKAGAAPWPADGARPPTRWSLDGGPFDIVDFEVQ